MSKKNSLIVSILIVSLLSIVVFAVTYAYIVFVTNEGNVNTGSSMLGINYGVPNDLTGSLSPSDSREKGLKTTATASLESSSESALFNMYITPTALSDNLKINAFKWEVEGLRDTDDDGVEEVVCTKNGNFSTAEIDNPTIILEGCELTTDTTTFNIYVWIDSNLINGAIGGANFSAKISADSVPITGEF